MCGIERSEYERHANFEKHISKEHDPWDYIDYLTYLKYKYQNNRLEMTFVENQVYSKYINKDYSFMPIGRSLTYETVKGQEEDSPSTMVD